MVIHEYGDSSLPKIVLLHPMMADAHCMLRLTESMEGKYCAIIPDLSGQGEDSGEYGNARQEAETLILYLKKNGYTELALLMGASIGGLVGMYLLGQGEISCKTAVFEGVPLYENAWLIYKFMKFGFLKKHRKAVQMPLAEVKKSMSARYGVFGDVMAENFVKMSEKSLINVVRDCSDFPFPPLPEAVQRRIFLEVGSKDINCRQNKTIWKHYPGVHIQVREGYGHCMYLSEHYAEYGKLLERYMREECKNV